MQEVNPSSVSFPSAMSQDALTAILRRDDQWLLAEAVEADVREWIESHAHAHVQDEAGRRRVGPQRLPAEAIDSRSVQAYIEPGRPWETGFVESFQ